MKKTLLLCLTAGALATASEIRFGHGTYALKGGFLGFTSRCTTDISSYSMVEQHKNILKSRGYYAYNITWYDSDELLRKQQTLNSGVSQVKSMIPGSSSTSVQIPGLEYRYQGLDVQAAIGYDLYHKGENDFFGMGILAGISLPWIDTQKSSDSLAHHTFDNIFEKSKTKIKTYRIGPSIEGRKSIGRFFSAYLSGTAAYQTGKIKNDYVSADFNANGWFGAFDAGLRFQSVSYDKKLFGITISPRLYANLGYRYSHWELKDVAIDISGIGVAFDKDTMKMSTSIAYFAIGYSF